MSEPDSVTEIGVVQLNLALGKTNVRHCWRPSAYLAPAAAIASALLPLVMLLLLLLPLPLPLLLLLLSPGACRS